MWETLGVIFQFQDHAGWQLIRVVVCPNHPKFDVFSSCIKAGETLMESLAKEGAWKSFRLCLISHEISYRQTGARLGDVCTKIASGSMSRSATKAKDHEVLLKQMETSCLALQALRWRSPHLLAGQPCIKAGLCLQIGHLQVGPCKMRQL